MDEKKLGRTLWIIANAVMCLAFLFSTVVQLNDPDPIRWMGVYGAATVVCGLELRRGVRAWIPALLAVLALTWAATIAPRVIGKVGFTEMFAEFEMRNAGVEEAREMYGLLFVAIWMGVIAAFERRSTRRRADEVLC
ncbi:MAG TPA: transmembrane 220 family protein [Gemmatimonadales bacterium]|nr:transmembrane 220 family protein [Gemmatimonadales bacterium]